MIYYVLQILNQIYCDGPILSAVQNSHMFPDSKHFVDMTLKVDPVQTLKNFNTERISEQIELNPISGKHALDTFVKTHFDPPGSELISCTPSDWTPSPHNLARIKDFKYRLWGTQINRIWKVLCRKVRHDVFAHQDHYSLLYVPHEFIIPGGRFREFYYWDTFWIIKGLLFSGMYETAQGMIENLAYMVEKYGFIPNGGRVYYMNRSQPPLLIPMVYELYVATGDIDFMYSLLPTLEKEYHFWTDNRAVVINPEEYGLPTTEPVHAFQYRVDLQYPRPESYREDWEIVQNMTKDRIRVWSDIAAAAETGWDFSTRWFSHSGPNAFRLDSIRTRSIVPVCLNAFLCLNARIMYAFFEIKGDWPKAIYYQERYTEAKRAMRLLHWNDTDGIWYDYDLESKRHVREYYISNALPLYAHCFDEDDQVAKRVYQYLKGVGAFNSTKGIPTSRIASSQQWDSSNAWPPMVHMVIEALRTSGDIELMGAAQKLASEWLQLNHRGYLQYRALFEKYNSSENGSYAGSGGEYEVQTGFGWTNGVVLDLLAKYGDVLTPNTPSAVSFNIPYLYYAILLICCALAPIVTHRFQLNLTKQPYLKRTKSKRRLYRPRVNNIPVHIRTSIDSAELSS